MVDIYTTVQGDTFDSIAFWLYGDEKYMKELIEANWDKAHILIFDSDVELFVPDIYEESDEDLPFWRAEDDDEDEDEETEDGYYEYEEEPDDEDLTDEESESEDPDIEDEEEY